MTRRIGMSVLALGLAATVPAFGAGLHRQDNSKEDRGSGDGKVIVVFGNATAGGACTTKSSKPGTIYTGSARSADGLSGQFTACESRQQAYNDCLQTDFNATLTDREGSSVTASGTGIACQNSANPPFYGAYKIDSGAGRFARTAGAGGPLSVVITGTASGFSFVATVVTPGR